ncbi:MAG: glycosyltransferase [Pyrinomonadaceae bacterium]|nr:glycosyltransferase [Pyrinomonadaceae bacterium]
MSVPVARSPALVHDYLLVMRGAERTFAAMADCFPGAPLYTLLYDPRATGNRFGDRPVHVSRLQRMGVRQRGFRKLLPLFPLAIERLPLRDKDLVVSSSSAFAHGVRVNPDATHVCYCHTPFRYAWHERKRALAEVARPLRPLLRAALARQRAWDRAAAARVTRYIANSQIARERIQRYWGRDAVVIHPPVEVDRFRVGEPEDFLLVVGELVAHKRVENALEAARRTHQPIVVVGTGPDFDRLRGRYASTATFLGRVTDDRLADLYSRARAVVIPGVEEFGIVAVEAQAAGRPVVAARAGGAMETVIPGRTGVLVPPDDAGALAEAIRELDLDRFSPEDVREQARRFSVDAFKERLMAELARAQSDQGSA